MNIIMMKCIVLILLVSSLISASTAEECNYEYLEMSLVRTEGNRYELSHVFFPPVDNPPEFVDVSYTFLESQEHQDWFWSSSTSSFIHPPEVLQFTSLFFSKPYGFYSGQAMIKLNTYENKSVRGCARALDKMQLLTQRLQLYAAQPSISSPKIDSTYTAKAYLNSEDKKNDTLKKFIFTNEAVNYNLDGLLVVTALLIFVLPLAIIYGIATLVVNSQHKSWDNEIKKRIPIMCSIAVISPVLCLYMLTVSICSVAFWIRTYDNHPLYKLEKPRNLGPILIITIVDLLSLLYCFVMIDLSGVVYHHQTCTVTAVNAGTNGNIENNAQRQGGNADDPYDRMLQKDIESWGISGVNCLTNLMGCTKLISQDTCNCNTTSWYVLLSLTILGPIVSVIAHSPYIAIAYLNDGYHAGSIFIYYTIVLCLGYSICWITYHDLKVEHNSMKLSWTETTTYSIIRGMMGLAVFLCLIIVITVYFVIIPINKSISDAPNRLVGIYQSGGFLIASFVTYKLVAFFYKINKGSSIDNAVTKRTKPLKQGEQDAWNAKSSEEKIEEFYEVVVEIASLELKKA